MQVDGRTAHGRGLGSMDKKVNGLLLEAGEALTGLLVENHRLEAQLMKATGLSSDDDDVVEDRRSGCRFADT